MRHPTTTRYQEDADADGWAETRVSAMRVELQAWRSQEQRLHVALRSEAALCQALREHVDLEEAARCRAQEEAVSERRSEEVVAQRSQQVRSAVARARQGTEKLAELMGVLRQAQSLAPSLQEEVEKLELEERQAQVSKWWAEKRWQDAARDLKLLEDQRQEVWLEEKETQLRMEEFSEQLTACQDKSVEMCRKQMQMRLELDEEHRQTRRLQRFRTPRDERMQETLLRHKSYAFALAANDGAPPG